MASNIQPKEGVDIMEGLRLSFNAAMYRNLFRKHNGSAYHDNKLKAEAELDKWFVDNIDGLPETLKPESNVD